MRCIAVIPVRLESRRFPRKALARLGRRPMIQWVYESVHSSALFDEVIVATDSREVEDVVNGFGGTVHSTSAAHGSGTDRVAEVARAHDVDVVANVQGDQPLVGKQALQRLLAPFASETPPGMVTLACPVDGDRMDDPNVVKVVRDRAGHALYFSRSAIPHAPDRPRDGLQHLGLYAFSRGFLDQFTNLPRGDLELAERLEQLRVLENGFEIAVEVVEEEIVEVNVPSDLARAEMALRLNRS